MVPYTPQHILRLEKKGRFPKRIQVGANRVAWLLSDIEKFIAEKQSIGDWMNEKLTMNITGLGKTKLYELRNTGKVRSSSLTERKLFYRRSDLERLLNKNQK